HRAADRSAHLAAASPVAGESALASHAWTTRGRRVYGLRNRTPSRSAGSRSAPSRRLPADRLVVVAADGLRDARARTHQNVSGALAARLCSDVVAVVPLQRDLLHVRPGSDALLRRRAVD